MNYPMTMEQYMMQQSLTEVEIAKMGNQIADALAALHQQGSVHGDIKPGNVLMLGNGRFRLLGMGEPRTTPLGNLPCMLAPELQEGSSYSPLTDIYALGMMMKSLLPKQGVSVVLEEMIDKASNANPALRYQSALEASEEFSMIVEVLEENTTILNSDVAPQQPSISNANPYSQQPSMSNANPYLQQPNMVNMNPYPQQPSMQGANPYPQQPQMQQPVYHQPQRQSQQPTVSRRNSKTQKINSQQTKHVSQENQKNQMVLQFLIPIVITLILCAAICIYFLLIRPGMNKEKQEASKTQTEQSQKEETTSATTEQEQGTQASEVKVPDCTKMNVNEAKNKLESMGFVVTITSQPNQEVDFDYVISHNPQPNSMVSPGTSIELVVSEGYNDCDYDQKIVVSAAPGATMGSLSLMNWEKGGWTSVYSTSCVVGRNGIGSNYGEGKGVTPLGTFKLGFVMSTVDPGNNMEYIQANSSLAIVDDTDSTLYNTMIDMDNVQDEISVDPVGSNIVKGKLNAIIFIEHNGNGHTSDNVVPGMGSVITICGNNNNISQTAGCIDISGSDMTKLLGLLDGTKNPHIEITLK
ncbi:MAG: PASTA domain-containing protein [Wujia sp.]